MPDGSFNAYEYKKEMVAYKNILTQEIKIINIFKIHAKMLFQKLIIAGCDEAGRG